MDKKINLTQLADLLSQEGGMSKSASEQFVKIFFDIISQSVLSDGLVKVKGLGTFKLLQMEDRESVNVNTGERFTIEGHQKISFTPDSDLKEVINKPFAAFETVEITQEQADTLVSMNTVSQLGEESDESTDEIAKEDIPVVEEKGAVVVENEMPLESGNDNVNGNDMKVEPTVREVTQKRGVRFLIKLLIWILAILLIVPLALYLFWPLIGNSVLEFVERDIKNRNKTEYVADSTRNVSKPVKETVPVTPQPSKPVDQPQEKPSQVTPAEQPAQFEPSVTVPSQQQTPLLPTPAQQPSRPEPVATTPAKPAASSVANGQSTSDYPAVKLNSVDTAKDLKDFTEADTVNFIMDSDLTVHTLKSDETITKLALKYYGTKKLWPYILKYNNVKDASKLHEGAKIRIPVLRAK